MSAERTFARDIADAEALRDAVLRLCQRVGQRLGAEGLRGRTVTVKLRLADFTTFSRSASVGTPIGDAARLAPVALGLLEREVDGRRRFRLLGVEVSNFEGAQQLALFDVGPP